MWHGCETRIGKACYFLYFILNPIATCRQWKCWSTIWGFVVLGMVFLYLMKYVVSLVSIPLCIRDSFLMLLLDMVPYGLKLKLDTHVFTKPPFVSSVKTCWNYINLTHLNTNKFIISYMLLWQSWVDGFVGR